MAQTHLHTATTSSKLFVFLFCFFLPLIEQCTNSWEGFSHGRRCFTNTWSDKHCTPTVNARPAFIGNHRGEALSLPHTPTHTYPHLHTQAQWLTQGHATAFIWYQTPLLPLWFPIKIKIGCSEIWRQGSLWVCCTTIAMLMQTAKGLGLTMWPGVPHI